ncbi:MAG: helix-turn-helix domain-containing protein [Solirubrobacterales bacterium]|nr:helix-turn-helix domain-containing protein [Solirubrobacterales bacterium]
MTVEQTLDQILDRVTSRHEELSREVTAGISHEIVEYGAEERNPAFWEDVRGFGDLQIQGAMVAARSGGEISPQALEVIREATVRRVRQGVPLESILQAFRLGHQIVWNAVVEESQQVEGGQSAAVHLTLPFLRFVDAVCACIAQAYLNELHTASVTADRAARDLLEILLEGELTEARRRSAQTASVSAGIELDVDAAHQVAIFVDEETSDTLRRLASELEALLGDSFVLGVMRHDELILVTDPGTDDPTGLSRILKERGARARDGLRAGVGLICEGSSGYSESAAQARSALDVAGAGRPVVGLADLPLLEYVTARPDPVAQAMVPSAVTELAGGTKAMDRALRETLFAYLGSGLNVMRTAESLPAHPNTVTYRLARLGERTGYDHRDPSQLVELAVALRIAIQGRSDDRTVTGMRWPTSGPLDISRWGSAG